MNPFRSPAAFCAVLVSLTPALAQSNVVVPMGAGVPNALDLAEGNGDLHVPAKQAPSRVLTVYRCQDLGVPAQGLTIQAVALRRDGKRSSNYKDHEWLQSVFVSSDGVLRPSRIGADSFAAAHGKDLSTVLQDQKIRWPVLPVPAQPPAPFAVQLPFSQPFVLLPGRDLCVEIRSVTPSTQSENLYWYVDFEDFDRSSAEGSVRRLGAGCPFGFQLYGASPPLDGETPLEVYSYTRLTGPGPQFALLLNGAQDQSFGPVPLPLDLTAFGAPGCRLYLEPLWTNIAVVDTSDARGLARFDLPPLPKNPRYAGVRIYQQALVVDLAANAFGMRFSNYLELTLGATADPLPARTLYHSSSATGDVPTRALDGGLVLELRTR